MHCTGLTRPVLVDMVGKKWQTVETAVHRGQKHTRPVVRVTMSKTISSTWKSPGSTRPFSSTFKSSYQRNLKGELDVKLLSLLQSAFPDVLITVDVLDSSTEQIKNFKALVAKSSNLQKIPFAWHIMTSDEYQKQVQATGDAKKFDFIHMIQLTVVGTSCGINVGTSSVLNASDYFTGRDVIAYVKSQSLKYDKYIIPNTFDITDCFDEGNDAGQRLLDFIIDENHFPQSITPEFRAGIRDLHRNTCSTEKDSRVTFKSHLSCVPIYA